MNIEQLCLEQEEIIEKQAAQIRGLLYELLQFRAVKEADRQLEADNIKGGQNESN